MTRRVLPGPASSGDPSLPATDSATVDTKEVENFLDQMVSQANDASRARSTRERYKHDWRQFTHFCCMTGRHPLPADVATVVRFLAWYGMGRRTSTLRSARAAIRLHHEMAGFLDPTTQPEITRFLSGHARLTGEPPRQKMALYVHQVRELCIVLEEEGGLVASRDRAAILLGYAAALRASEVVAARIQDVEIVHRGLTLTIPRSKTDQEGQGQYVAVVRTATLETCPVTAVEEWLALLKERGCGPTDPLFPALRASGDPALRQGRLEYRPLSTQGYRAMLKQRCAAIGIDPARIGGHSLRAGHATQAAEKGVDIIEIAQQGRWKDLRKVMVYVRSGRRFTFNSSAKLGL
ncbi:site-specific integrase [Belnapia moabensis]|uniref:site-specific integrase n=1 Tax=Belnapia moabensis TaxID=365533 RepID=UPI0005B8A2E9|nr:site-specific integrase [Belnapia moabensis]